MRNEKTAILAVVFHEDWRMTRLREDGLYDPRWKTTNDKTWIEEHHGTEKVDIANTAYNDLPSDWQAENKAAAEVVVGILERFRDVDLDDSDTYNQVGEEIHQAWLERNPWARGGDLDVSFSELPKSEQLKDIAQMEAALELFGKDV